MILTEDVKRVRGADGARDVQAAKRGLECHTVTVCLGYDWDL